ncbi:SRPBCC family protein [Salinactinospora qingdaonensis]|uniref:SRPBCC family protein n=1 Tax=Salinactinospora qingdaonensis TaxID=702744 RepID=A0ABP7FAW0_9ACTN
MAERSVVHDTFVIERSYPASPAQVFAAWADPAAKARWFAGPDEWARDHFEMDFRVGGRESNSGGPQEGPTHVFDAVYQDIVPDERIVYSYTMDLDGRRISASVATVEFRPEDGGTRLVFTEQGAFLDGLDESRWRQQGTNDLLDALGVELGRIPATA